MKTIALDAMGSDRAPVVEVEGAIAAAHYSRDLRILLVGQADRLEAELQRHGARHLPIEIRHAAEVITMEDAPSIAVRRKRDASMKVAFNLVKSGEADAVISAGNSGAMMACGLLVLKRIKGVDRPAILTTFPTQTGQAAILDMGANVECRPLHLVQFAVMGACFSQALHGVAHPRVGVLSNGSEEHKGTELTREANRLLRSGPTQFNFIGYSEGRDIFSGDVDVVVCDGFTGNLVLKVTEGVAETLVAFFRQSIGKSWMGKLAALALYPAFSRVKKRIDYAEQGGAPLLGVNGAAIVCHGGSNSAAIKNAILGVGRYLDADLTNKMTQAIDAHRDLFVAARTQKNKNESLHELTNESNKTHQTTLSNASNETNESHASNETNESHETNNKNKTHKTKNKDEGLHEVANPLPSILESSQ